jgi:hypothetical protein
MKRYLDKRYHVIMQCNVKKQYHDIMYQYHALRKRNHVIKITLSCYHGNVFLLS